MPLHRLTEILCRGAFAPTVSQTRLTRDSWMSARYHQFIQFMALCAHQENLTRSVLQDAKQISSNYSLLLTNSCCFSHPLQQQVLGDNVKPQEKDDKNKNVISFFLRFCEVHSNCSYLPSGQGSN